MAVKSPFGRCSAESGVLSAGGARTRQPRVFPYVKRYATSLPAKPAFNRVNARFQSMIAVAFENSVRRGYTAYFTCVRIFGSRTEPVRDPLMNFELHPRA